MLGFESIADALRARPRQMVSVSPETWSLLDGAFAGGGFTEEFAGAWANGVAFLGATDGLRHRRPLVVEWKGSHRAPGDEVAPIDLRVDHVFLVSCKYLSKILLNASPFRLFERLLEGGQGGRDRDWYAHAAPREYERLYAAVRHEIGPLFLPDRPELLSSQDRSRIAEVMGRTWPKALEDLRAEFVQVVSEATARIWSAMLDSAQKREALLWRMLRIGSAPYYVLGSSRTAVLQIRVATPWDWRQRYRLRDLRVGAQQGGQPRVGWLATVEDRNTREATEVRGHVEIRWAHGRFSGNPEAKVYLDTPHAEVPGYFSLT